jgi:hypothetical protein
MKKRFKPSDAVSKAHPGLSHMKLHTRHSDESRSPDLMMCYIFVAKLLTSVTRFPPSRE